LTPFLRRLAKITLILTVLIYGAWWWLLRSDWLREKLRARAMQEIERATGGKAELGRLDFDPSLLGATFEGFVLHGTEASGAPPLVQAERIEVGLKILSFLKQDVDIGRIEIIRPKINVTVDAAGKSNLPSPAQARAASGRGPVDDLLRLAADSFVIRDGEFSYDAKKHRFSASGRNLQAMIDYDAKGPVYRGTVASDSLEVQAGALPRLPVNAALTLVIANDTVEFSSIKLQSESSTLTGKGKIENFRAARGEFDISVQTDLAESARLFRAPAGRGVIRTAGKFLWLGGTAVRYEGDLQAPALDVNVRGVRVQPLSVTARLLATEKELTLTGLQAKTAEGKFTGSVSLPKYEGYLVDGTVEGLALQTILARTGNNPMAYNGAMSGPLRLQGGWNENFVAETDLKISPGEGGVPLTGQMVMKYDNTARQVVLRDSFFSTPNVRLDVSGTLHQTLRVKLAATKMEDLRPALALAGVTEPLPVTLDPSGSVYFEGTVSGPLPSPLIAGQLRSSKLRWDKVPIDSLSSTLVAAADKLTLTRFSLAQGTATANGNATIGLRNWKITGASTIDLRADARNLNVETVRTQAGMQEPVSGLLHATANVQGTLDDPSGEVQVDWFRPAYGADHLDRIRATVQHAQNTLRVTALEASRGAARVTGTGTYSHTRSDWKTGTASIAFQIAGLELNTIPAVQEFRKGAGGTVAATGKADARVANGTIQLTSLNGDARLTNLALAGRNYGDASVSAATGADGEVAVDGKVILRGSPITATSKWRLAPGYPGTAHVEFGEVLFATVNELRPADVPDPLPFVGGFRGSADFTGPAFDMDRWKVDVTLNEVYARPPRRQSVPGKLAAQEFELRNDGPVRFSADGRTVTIGAARFIAKDTNLSLSGTFSLAQSRPWDLKVNGQLNLAGVQTFSPEIVASGVATVQANIRGELANPQAFGALELKNATLNIDGVPNGLDKVSGRVLFDRRRATIENRLTAETGGGALALSGFLDFSVDDTFYRLQAEASSVRIRYPEGVSTVADANISLSGTTERSLLAGNVTVLRSGFTPKTDFGGLLAESNRGQSTPNEANRFLANMQIDVKIRTAPETQFTTSLTNDLQAEANLQLRGTGARPVALGRITISQGDINFFGNKYTIKRGEVSFYNPTRVEPTLDLDLETRVRGVDVTVNFTGPIDKLNVSYRSDPPLQPSEIVALLTVGRSPTAATVGSSQSGARGTFLESGANSLLGSAISAPISSQLQRFFGVSRIKIDPTIVGMEGTPQARVTVEQQVSKDVTITFVTNLTRSQQQVVRLEWNLTKEWSLIALRDENGAFGVDMQMRKQKK